MIDLNGFPNCRILVIGDLMIDEYVWGTVDRISPRGAGPDRLGGPRGLHPGRGRQCGQQPGRPGRQSMGCPGSSAPVPTAGCSLTDSRPWAWTPAAWSAKRGAPTTRKTRVIAANQHVLRIDRETRREISAAARKKTHRLGRKRPHRHRRHPGIGLRQGAGVLRTHGPESLPRPKPVKNRWWSIPKGLILPNTREPPWSPPTARKHPLPPAWKYARQRTWTWPPGGSWPRPPWTGF